VPPSLLLLLLLLHHCCMSRAGRVVDQSAFPPRSQRALTNQPTNQPTDTHESTNLPINEPTDTNESTTSCGAFEKLEDVLGDVDAVLFINFYQLFCFLWMNAVIQACFFLSLVIRRRSSSFIIVVVVHLWPL
jgi:hypothetical protein